MTENDYTILKERLAERLKKGEFDLNKWEKFESAVIEQIEQYLKKNPHTGRADVSTRKRKQRLKEANKQIKEIENIQKFLKDKAEDYILDEDIFIDTAKIKVTEDDLERFEGYAHHFCLWQQLAANVAILRDGLEWKKKVYTGKAGNKNDPYKEILFLDCTGALEFILNTKPTLSRNEGNKFRALINTLIDEIDGPKKHDENSEGDVERDCYETMKKISSYFQGSRNYYKNKYAPDAWSQDMIQYVQRIKSAS